MTVDIAETPRIKLDMTHLCTVAAKYEPPIIVANQPTNFRLARKLDGELILQGQYRWTRGFNEHGSEWRDLETIILENQE